ncbi:MAG: cellulase family glycosylhydrolase [Armatimonadetes bacterium]|nr:cellulase family glycosylhydrolase [Armatimonadota bacterium]MDW8120771.1 cellulase family glycosylhydrolase [Armatimonadota bacterium]
MKRRELIKGVTLLASGIGLKGNASAPLPEPSPRKLPRWRGFNLLEKFHRDWSNGPFFQSDFEWIAELGFNFVRLPMDYRCWTEETDWTKLKEPVLKEIDQAVEWGRQYGIHICINFHRAPGYTVASPPEPKSLWTDEEAQRVCCGHWRAFAKRYKGIGNRFLSFNLFNEPARISADVHRKVVERVTAAIREEDENRLIICDGREWGNEPPHELAGLRVAAATRGYRPFTLTHFKAEWVAGSEQWGEPTHPHREGSTVWDKDQLHRTAILPWKELEKQGFGVMVGEFGSYNKTPHKVVLAWMKDCLELWREAGWGWALWNFRGSFGILDSGRVDVAYENWRGHKLDRQMLELLQSH